MFKFCVGMPVQKIGGKYQGPGLIVGETLDLDAKGYKLFNVAMQVAGGKGWFVHVFPASGLQALHPSHSQYEVMVERFEELMTFGNNAETVGVPRP